MVHHTADISQPNPPLPQPSPPSSLFSTFFPSLDVTLVHDKPTPWLLDLRVLVKGAVLRSYHDALHLVACTTELSEHFTHLRPLKLQASGATPRRLWLAFLAVVSVVSIWGIVRLSTPSSASASLFLLLPFTSCTSPLRLYRGVQWSASESDVSLAQSATVDSLPTRCPIFTFFQPVEELAYYQADKRVEMWKAWYYTRGWLPIVLNTQMAMALPHAREYEAAYVALPTVNVKQYEVNCFLRWMAIAQRPGGGLFLDYDIFDMTVPGTPSHPELMGSCSYGRLTTYGNHRPMVTHGNASELLGWVKYLAGYQMKDTDRVGWAPHISDMLIARQTDPSIPFYERPPIPWFHFSHYALDRMEPYAPDLPFQNRMLHLHFLASHRLHMVGAGIGTKLLGEVLALCGKDEWTEGAEAFCDFPWVFTGGNATHYIEPKNREEFRTEVCHLIRPQPWKLSDISCRPQQGMSGEEEGGGKTPFVVAVVANPVVQSLRAMEVAKSGGGSQPNSSAVVKVLREMHTMAAAKDFNEPTWLSTLYRTPPNPFLHALTEAMPPCTALRERWEGAVVMVRDIKSTLLFAEEDVPKEVEKMRGLVQRRVGFDVPGMDGRWGEMEGERCQGECEGAVLVLQDWQVEAIKAWNVLDVELYRLIRQRFEAREAEWTRL